MNERMLKLYKQAQAPSIAIDPSNNLHYETTTFSAENFAELIVRECISKIEAEHTDALDNHLEDWDRGYLSGLRVANEIIRKHFDVDYFGDD